MVKSVRSRKRVDRDQRAFVNWSSETSKLERNWFRSISRMMVLLRLLDATNTALETRLRSQGTPGCSGD